MSEAWREVARLGKKGEKYPHILVDSHGWCLRLGPRDREDERHYRRKDQESARGVAEMKDLLLRNLQEARELGEELQRLWRNCACGSWEARVRLRDCRGQRMVLSAAGSPRPRPKVGLLFEATDGLVLRVFSRMNPAR